MHKLACLLTFVGLSTISPPTASASETDTFASSPQPRFELGLSMQGALSVDGGPCRREQSDVVGCTGLAYAQLSVASGVRLNRWLSLAVVQGIGLADRATVWQTTAEARVHPVSAGAFDPSLGFDAGLLQLIDRLSADEVGPKEQVNNLAGTISALAELAWQLSDGFALHLDARALPGFPARLRGL